MKQLLTIELAGARDGGMLGQLFIYIIAKEEEHVQTHGSSVYDAAIREQVFKVPD